MGSTALWKHTRDMRELGPPNSHAASGAQAGARGSGLERQGGGTAVGTGSPQCPAQHTAGQTAYRRAEPAAPCQAPGARRPSLASAFRILLFQRRRLNDAEGLLSPGPNAVRPGHLVPLLSWCFGTCFLLCVSCLVFIAWIGDQRTEDWAWGTPGSDPLWKVDTHLMEGLALDNLVSFSMETQLFWFFSVF